MNVPGSLVFPLSNQICKPVVVASPVWNAFNSSSVTSVPLVKMWFLILCKPSI